MTALRPTKDEGGFSIHRTRMTMSPGADVDGACSENRIAVPDRRPFAGYSIQSYLLQICR